MSPTICLAANKTLRWPKAGGHFWVYLNWALGLRALGCDVIWLERVTKDPEMEQVRELVKNLKYRLEPYGLGGSLALVAEDNAPLPQDVLDGCIHFDQAVEADLLLNLAYDISCVDRFRRSAFVDIDPGLTQIWIAEYGLDVRPHDVYFTIGETVGQPDAPFPDLGVRWHFTPPPIVLALWPQATAPPAAAFTTVTNWWGGWMYGDNAKATGFLPFLDLPQRTHVPLELAVCLGDDRPGIRPMLEEHGWRVQNAWDVAATPWDYQRYIQESLGEFTCVKPSCVRLQNAWVSDRSTCYLATGKPVVVQHTGPSRFLPDRGGMFRFRDPHEAAQCLEIVAADYEHQCELARALAEEHFDSTKTLTHVLETALS